jgi:hypothetical protein
MCNIEDKHFGAFSVGITEDTTVSYSRQMPCLPHTPYPVWGYSCEFPCSERGFYLDLNIICMLGVLFLYMGRDCGQAFLVLRYPVRYLCSRIKVVFTIVVRGYLCLEGLQKLGHAQSYLYRTWLPSSKLLLSSCPQANSLIHSGSGLASPALSPAHLLLCLYSLGSDCFNRWPRPCWIVTLLLLE